MSDRGVLTQVENKFLVSVSGGILLLWDQHALHERIRLEQLQQRYVSNLGDKVVVLSEPAPDKFALDLTAFEMNLVETHQHKLKLFGLQISGRDS